MVSLRQRSTRFSNHDHLSNSPKYLVPVQGYHRFKHLKHSIDCASPALFLICVRSHNGISVNASLVLVLLFLKYNLFQCIGILSSDEIDVLWNLLLNVRPIHQIWRQISIRLANRFHEIWQGTVIKTWRGIKSRFKDIGSFSTILNLNK